MLNKSALLLLCYIVQVQAQGHTIQNLWQSNPSLKHIKAAFVQGNISPSPEGYWGQGSSYGNPLALEGNLAFLGTGNFNMPVHSFEYVDKNWVNTDRISFIHAANPQIRITAMAASGQRLFLGSDTLQGDDGIKTGGVAVFEKINLHWEQVQLIKPDELKASDYFGAQLHADGDRAVISAIGDSEHGKFSGAVYVFDRTPEHWQLTQKIANPMDGSFGSSVHLAGDLLAIGAVGADNNGVATGAVHIYRWDGFVWLPEQTLYPENANDHDRFGATLAFNGQDLLIAATDSNWTGNDSGVVYYYRENAGQWTFVQNLYGSLVGNDDHFGTDLAMAGNQAIIGVKNNNSPGRAYLFELNNGLWGETQILSQSHNDFSSTYGEQVEMNSTHLLIADPRDDAHGKDAGAVFPHLPDNGSWIQSGSMEMENGANFDYFGWSISLSGDRALVGAYGDDDNGEESGAAYILDWDGQTWVKTHKLKASDGAAGDQFGHAVALSGDTAVIGAHGKDGILDEDIGQAYVFQYTQGQWMEVQTLRKVPSNADQEFGRYVAIDGDHILVNSIGNPGYDVDFYYRSGNLWNHKFQAKGPPFGGFAVHGNSALIGDPNEGFMNQGGADLYKWRNDVLQWEDRGTIHDSYGPLNAYLGTKVALSDNYLALSSHHNGPSYISIYKRVNDQVQLLQRLNLNDPLYITRYVNSMQFYGDRLFLGMKTFGPSRGVAEMHQIIDNRLHRIQTIPDTADEIDSHHFFFANAVAQSEHHALIGSHQHSRPTAQAGAVFHLNWTTAFALGGFVNGLYPNNSVTLQNNGGDDLTVAENGFFVFDALLGDAQGYTVAVHTQPAAPMQNCTVVNDTGAITGDDVFTLEVNCDAGTDRIFYAGF